LFPYQFLSKGCDPACEVSDQLSTPMMMCSAGGPSAPERCTRPDPTDSSKHYQPLCAADELCIPTPDLPADPYSLPGRCAPRSSERRLCVKTCGGNDDCRGGYTCRRGGTKGSLPLLTNSCGNVSFCAPLGI
jgi:hypothetical protein